MTRTKNWLLIGTILPGLTLAQSGFSAQPMQTPTRLAQAPAPSDGDPPDGRQRQRAPGVPRAPDPQRAPPGVERPTPPAAPGAASPAAPRPPAGTPPAPRRDPPMPRPVPPIITPGAQQPGRPPAAGPRQAQDQEPAARPAQGQRGDEPGQPRRPPPSAAPERPTPPAARPPAQPQPGRSQAAPPAGQPAPAPGAARPEQRQQPPAGRPGAAPPRPQPPQPGQAQPGQRQPQPPAGQAQPAPSRPLPGSPGVSPQGAPLPRPGQQQPSQTQPGQMQPSQRQQQSPAGQPGTAPARPLPGSPGISPQGAPLPQTAPQQPGQPQPAQRPPQPGQPQPGQTQAAPPSAGQSPAAAPAQRPPQPGQPQPGQTQAAPPPAGQPPAAAPGQPPAPDRQGRRGGIGPGGAAAIGLGAGAIGGIMATQGASRIDDVRGRREERREGDVTIIREPGRTIIRDNDRAIIQRDETERFRELGWQGRTERRGDERVTVFERPDGSRITTVTDEEGRLIRRTRRMRDGQEIVIIDNVRRDRPDMRFSEEVVVLPPPPLPMPRERYIVDAEHADEDLIYETITAPPIAAIPRRYTLDEVRYSPDLRARMRSVDIDTVNFDTGSWEVSQGQAQKLAVIAASIRRALERSPNEVFLVEGHTDAVGSDDDNLSLSDRRAQSVAEILTRDFQVPPENLTSQGYGEQYPKVQTQDASRENRRVTLRRITPLLAGQSGQ